MDRMTIDGRDYAHHKEAGGWDVLSYYDAGCQKTVSLRFPPSAQSEPQQRVIEVLSGAFLSGLLSDCW